MALDAQVADRLWNDRYEQQMRNLAFKNKWMNEFQDPEDLFQDMAINVWMKAVREFKPAAVTFTEDVDRAFNAFFATIYKQYMANLAKHHQTGKQDFLRTQVERGDRPLSGEDGEGGATLMDMLPGEDFWSSLHENRSFEQMVSRLDPMLEEIVRYIVDTLESGNSGEVWAEIRQRWGLTHRQLFNELVEEPDFVEWALSIENG